MTFCLLHLETFQLNGDCLFISALYVAMLRVQCNAKCVGLSCGFIDMCVCVCLWWLLQVSAEDANRISSESNC